MKNKIDSADKVYNKTVAPTRKAFEKASSLAMKIYEEATTLTRMAYLEAAEKADKVRKDSLKQTEDK